MSSPKAPTGPQGAGDARRQVKWLWQRLNRLAAMQITREQLLMKLGAAGAKAPIGWRLIDITVDPASASLPSRSTNQAAPIRRREGAI